MLCVCVAIIKSDKIDFFHELEGILAAQHRAIQCGATNVPIIPIRIQKIAQTIAPPLQVPAHAIVIEPSNLSSVKEVDSELEEDDEDKDWEEQGEEEYYELSPWHRCPTHRQRNLFDLVLESEFPFEQFLGDWIEDEFFWELDQAYLVS